MTTAHNCPQCGNPLAGDAPQGLCPECLLKAALSGQSATASAATGVYDSTSATASVPEIGARLKYFGDYELLEEIARGGMGVVWKARQTSLHRDVAVKMIRAGALASPEEVQRFLREAEAAANLQHPNIVAIHEVSEHDGQHYFSMDYVAGRDLGAMVKDGPLSAPVAARYVKIIAEAIHFAHQRGTLHRDLKPQNVLIDAMDQPRITDFGLAKIMKEDSGLTQTGVVMGSPSYMPPEQAAGRNADIGPASDVYSLGAILYELLTGRPPFRGATPLATLREVMEAEPAPPRRLQANIPADLETICLKCLEKAPAARYATARALAEELERYLKGEPILARPASTVRKALSWARRHPRILAMLATFVIIALTSGVLYLLEENAFLRAQQADPTLARVSGPRQKPFVPVKRADTPQARLTDRYLLLMIPNQILMFGCLLLAILLRREHDKKALSGRMRTLAACAGLVLVGSGAVFLVYSIQAYVREGESMLGHLLTVCGLINIGVFIFMQLIRDYRRAQHGLATRRKLTPDQFDVGIFSKR